MRRLGWVVVGLLALVGSRQARADDALVKLIAQVKPAVVAIRTSEGSGSGFIVSEELVVTNYHVIEGADAATVKRVDGMTVAANGVKFVDTEFDIAVLSVPGIGKNITPLKVSTTLPPQGQDVIAVGNPLGFEFSVTKGIVSAVRSAESMKRLLPGLEVKGTWIQTDVAISPGNSGGPLLLMTGEVVGMNTFTRRDSQNLNFAVSGTDIVAAVDQAATARLQPFQVASSKESSVKNEGADDQITELVVGSLEESIRKLSTSKLQRLEEVDADKVRDLLEPQSIKAVDAESVARVRGTATLVQILPDAVLVLIDDAICMVFTNRAGEIGAKTGGRAGTPIPVDDVFIVGQATPYMSRTGTKFAIPLIPLLDLKDEYWKEPIEELIAEELKKKGGDRMARLARAAEQSLKKLRHTFSDATGSYKVDAAAVGLDDERVTLVRMDTRKTITVPLEKLSYDDQQWLEANKIWIKVKGPRLQDFLTKAAKKDK